LGIADWEGLPRLQESKLEIPLDGIPSDEFTLQSGNNIPLDEAGLSICSHYCWSLRRGMGICE
jgi:hypothetical protein